MNTQLSIFKKHFSSLIDLIGGSAIGGMTSLTSYNGCNSHKA